MRDRVGPTTTASSSTVCQQSPVCVLLPLCFVAYVCCRLHNVMSAEDVAGGSCVRGRAVWGGAEAGAAVQL